MIGLLQTRRSIRNFNGTKVERQKIDTILKAALLGPCSRANRTWELVAITDHAVISKLSQCRESSSQFLKGAPFVIAIVSTPDVADTWIEDSAIAATLMQITAHSLGLGSCWCQVRGRYHSGGGTSSDYVREVLQIPEGRAVTCMLGIGYPSQGKEGYTDIELPYHKIHYNRY